MAFDKQQARRVQAGVAIAVLVLVAIIAAVVLSGAFLPKAPQQDGAATAQVQGSAEQDQAATDGAQAGDEHDMSHVDASYTTAEQQLLALYEADQTNPSALLNLANGYFDWGVAAMDVAETHEDDEHVIDLFNKAIERYDEYLKANPGSKSVQVDRAICIFYAGDHTKAIKTLEDFTASDDSFAPAWANLGMFYESEERTDDARAAYEKAIEKDPDGTYNVKSYAEQRLANLA